MLRLAQGERAWVNDVDAARWRGRAPVPVAASGPSPFDEGNHMPDMDDLKKLAKDHDDQIDAGLDRAGDAAKAKVGHDDQIDKAVDKAQDATG